eukprot:scaffold451861_cov29-Prasinocladus_malaysianus.AAC.1
MPLMTSPSSPGKVNSTLGPFPQFPRQPHSATSTFEPAISRRICKASSEPWLAHVLFRHTSMNALSGTAEDTTPLGDLENLQPPCAEARQDIT